MKAAAAMVGIAVFCLAARVAAVAAAPEPLGLTTAEQRIVPAGAAGFDQLAVGPGEARAVRDGGFGAAQPGREQRRVSLAYFGQLSDFQLADEESPARVEFIDFFGTPVEAAFRPWEALQPHVDEAMIRQVNAFSAASPVPSADGSRSEMDFVIDTGDSADNQQLNETEWVRTLLEGGALDPNSGVDPAGYSHALCPPVGVPGATEAASYTGVQDYDDYMEGLSPYFYDPDDPRGMAAGWPLYPGLMDRAQQPFEASGLDAPSYVSFGNHDALAQGNQAANASFEQVATGCMKPMELGIGDLEGLAELGPEAFQEALESNPGAAALVPPDPDRRYVSKSEYKQVFLDGGQADGHGFAHIDPAEETASGGAAGYYSFVPVPGLRVIALDTVCEGGVTGPCADGNIDHPQFLWLEGELGKAAEADQLVVLFGHHAIPSLTADVPDEVAPPCTGPDAHGHDVNPGCDADPRASTPIHLGADMEALLHRHPHVIAWVAGHSHVNDVTAYPAPDGSGHGFWSIRTAAEADWPQQTRLLEIFDNGDGTLSIFGTIVDHAGKVTAPAPGSDAALMTPADLASVGRTLSYNDHQTGGRACSPDPCGEGTAEDRNVELLVADPRSEAGVEEPEPNPVPEETGTGGGPSEDVEPASAGSTSATAAAATQAGTRRRRARSRCGRGARRVRVVVRRNGRVVRGRNGRPRTRAVCRKRKARAVARTTR
jgi:metallophosphoesterase (TIGR03767 family)